MDDQDEAMLQRIEASASEATVAPVVDALWGPEFVFLDDKHDPYYARVWSNEWWLYYWHPCSGWVSFRKIEPRELVEMKAKALPAEQAQLYHDRHDQRCPR